MAGAGLDHKQLITGEEGQADLGGQVGGALPVLPPEDDLVGLVGDSGRRGRAPVGQVAVDVQVERPGLQGTLRESGPNRPPESQ